MKSLNIFSMEILANLINVLTDKIIDISNKINDMNDRNIINIVLSKLDFTPNHYKIIKKNNKIYIKCHTYFINVFNDNNNDNDNDEDFKKKIIEYNQPLIIINDFMYPPRYFNDIINNIDDYKDKRNLNLYICITYADITIDLDNNNYIIEIINFNIRKPTNDTYKLFETIINNIDNPSYYFKCDYDLTSYNIELTDINNNIYDLNIINLSFINDINDDNIDIDVIMQSVSSISTDIDIKPMISNQIKIKILNGGFI